MAELEIRDLRKSFGGVHALDGADLHCLPGEVHALLGENGAGKSTLIKILSGVLRADSGVILLDGRALHVQRPAHAIATGIGTAFQELSGISNLSVAQNLLLGSEPRNILGMISRRQLIHRSEAILHDLGIERIPLSAPLSSLSMPDRQILEIAKVLRRKPHVLILDEATSSLSHQDVAWLLGQARRVAEGGGVVLFISHRLQEIDEVADRITVLRDGKRVAEGCRGEMKTGELITAMLGHRVDRLFPDRTGAIGDTAVEIRGFRAGPRMPREGVNISIRRGEILGIAGLPGQGQVDLLLGLYGAVPHHGEIRIRGRQVSARSSRRALKAGIALVPEDRQQQGLFLPLSLRHNVSVAILSRLSHLGWLRTSLERRVVSAQNQRLHLPAGRLELPVMNLSGGNQQKVIFSKVMLTNPRLLLLLDCTRGVDVGTKAEIFSLISELADGGTPIVFYSTDLTELVNLADRVVVFYEGRIGSILNREDLSEKRLLHAAFGAGVEEDEHTSAPGQQAAIEPNPTVHSGKGRQ